MSPRAFDSDDVRRAVGASALRFTAWVECARCGCEFEGTFLDSSGCTSVEDVTDAPLGEHWCPQCGRRWTSQYPGWTFYSEAG